MRFVSISHVAALLVVLTAAPLTRAQDARALQQRLESKYSITTLNAEGAVVIQGATLTLKKNGFTAGVKIGCLNEYKDGKISLANSAKAACSTTTRRFAGLPGLGGIPAIGVPAGTAQVVAPPTRPFVMGERLWVTSIDIKDGVGLALVSDVINETIYKGELRIPGAKNSVPDFAQVDHLLGELFAVTPGDNQQGQQQQAPQQTQQQGGQRVGDPGPPQAQGAALPDIPPPPPPPDQPGGAPAGQPAANQPPTQTLSLGLTIDQVVGILGQPATVADLGSKKIYTYKSPSMKITFVNGKVTDMQ
jgi:hypothetical protein